MPKVYKKETSIHRILSFCEIIIFIKNLNAILLEKNLESKKIEKDGLLNEANIEKRWLTSYNHELGLAKESVLLENIKCFWKNLDTTLWSSATYELMKDFCLNSSIFVELQGYK